MRRRGHDRAGDGGGAAAEPDGALGPDLLRRGRTVLWGVINLLASPSPTRARTTYIQVSGGFYGISGSLAPCGVGVTVHWRNLRTGAKGAVHGRVSGIVVPFAGTLMYREPVTGSGPVELTVQPHRPYLPKPPVRVQIP
ncbi:hypothetical protein V1Y59_18450 [Gordonia sp. PKS22-38]|uniref:Uncharacterized protein n=1 Tax=Gordonia prachuapensis TaxID=3115651 RepID=A0ABU7MXP3_9ACTN|nr:hypothetical protein [Gordonia sp. PKS22-38]